MNDPSPPTWAGAWSSWTSTSSPAPPTSPPVLVPPPRLSTSSLLHPCLPLLSSTRMTPTKVLTESIRQRDWDATRIRVLSHPWDAMYRTNKKQPGSHPHATPLHLACLYRAPRDVVQLLIHAHPSALLCQDSQGWTPLHVSLLYNGHDEATVIMLIRRGGAAAAAIQSQGVGTPLHLALRHGCSTAIIQELLKVNPAMATTANEQQAKPAKILWHYYSNHRQHGNVLGDIALSRRSSLSLQEQESLRELVERLTLLVRAAKGHQLSSGYKNDQQQQQQDTAAPYSQILHDVVVATEETLGDLSLFLPLVVLLYPEQLGIPDDFGNLPLHKAASNPPKKNIAASTVVMSAWIRAFVAPSCAVMQKDPVEILVRGYPMAASIPNVHGHLPLHLALVHGQRTWRTGISALLLAAPQALLMLHSETRLLPFQLAAVAAAAAAAAHNDDNEQQQQQQVLETILQLLLACPHAMPFRAASQ